MSWSRTYLVGFAALTLLAAFTQGAAARPPDRPLLAAAPQVLPDLGSGGEALALNDHGLVVGDVLDANGMLQSAIWRNHVLRLIPTTGLLRSTALDVNDNGLVVGQGLDAAHHRHGFTYRHGLYRLLAAPFAGGTDVQVRRVNGSGEIVGTAADLDGLDQAVIWRGPTAQPVILPPLTSDGGSFAHGVNDEGDVAGSSDSLDASTEQPVRWTWNGMPRALSWTHGLAEAFAINNRDEVTGAGLTGSPDDPATQSHILVWQARTPRDLGTLPGDDDAGSLAINEHGVIGGFSADDFLPTDSGNVRAVVWLGHGALRVLPRPGADNFSTAHDVNNHGQIAGLVGDATGLTYAVLWQLHHH